MTIKDFASLCGCNPKTLRYYDQIDLLKPARVDKFSGYRHYDERQAIVFVKIKNLQSAGFTIDEIRGLIDKGNDEICRAFDAKIREQEARLQKIREIQQSYLSEMKEMDRKILEIREHVEKALSKYEPLEEFGINDEQYDEIKKAVYGFFEGVVSGSSGGTVEFHEDKDDSDHTEEEEYLEFLNNPEYETVYENHGWQHIKDIVDELRANFGTGEHAVLVKATNDTLGTAYAVIMLGMFLKDKPHEENHISCNVTRSEDGINHIWILKRK